MILECTSDVVVVVAELSKIEYSAILQVFIFECV